MRTCVFINSFPSRSINECAWDRLKAEVGIVRSSLRWPPPIHMCLAKKTANQRSGSRILNKELLFVFVLRNRWNDLRMVGRNVVYHPNLITPSRDCLDPFGT